MRALWSCGGGKTKSTSVNRTKLALFIELGIFELQMARHNCHQLGISSHWTPAPKKPTSNTSDTHWSAQEQSHKAKFIF